MSQYVKHTGGVERLMEFCHRNKNFSIKFPDDGTLELYVDGCLRKSRSPGKREPQYVWTNVELLWEEHVYIEARYWSASGRLEVTVNGEILFEGVATP
ncbi:MAG: hypothetical protein O7F71_19445 [Gammaproteobacteria bacterium]|nr:hypothetical protein [Gammaproteobacteria bacterium]